MWPLSSMGGGKALVAGSLKKNFFCGFPNQHEHLGGYLSDEREEGGGEVHRAVLVYRLVHPGHTHQNKCTTPV